MRAAGHEAGGMEAASEISRGPLGKISRCRGLACGTLRAETHLMTRGKFPLRGAAGILLAALIFFPTSHAQSAEVLKISSPAFAEGGMIPARFTADGANVNPPLEISGAPASARSLVLIVDDPDAPGGTWNHWLLWNIAPDTSALAEDATPAGATTGRNDFGRANYLGPSPPSGTHRYRFQLYALDTPLDLRPGAPRQELDRAMAGHILGRATLSGRYSRKK